MLQLSSAIAVVALDVLRSRSPARAEVQTVRIGETFGLTHLPSYIVEDLHSDREACRQAGHRRRQGLGARASATATW